MIAQEKSEEHNELYRKEIAEQARGFAFLGTPHRGSSLSLPGIFFSMFEYWTGSNLTLLELLRNDSLVLNELHDAFVKATRDALIVCFYETLPESLWGVLLFKVIYLII